MSVLQLSPLKRAKGEGRRSGKPALKDGPMRLSFDEGQTRSPLKRAAPKQP